MRQSTLKDRLQKVQPISILVLIVLVAMTVASASIIAAHAWTNSGMLKLIQARLLSEPEERVRISQQAENDLRKALAYRPENQGISRGIGLSLFTQGDESSAIEIWEQAGISSAEIFASWGTQAFKVEKYDEALRWNQKAISLDQSLSNTWYQIGIINRDKGQDSEAIEALEHSLAQGIPESTSPLGWLLFGQGSYQKSTAIWQKALTNFPDEPMRLNWWLALAASLRADGNNEAELSALGNGLKEFPNSPRLNTQLGKAIYEYHGDVDAASSYFYLAVELDSGFADAYGAFANMMASEDHYEDAYGWYSRGIELDPNRPWWHAARANMQRDGGDIPHALTSYQKTIKRFPDYSQAYYEMAWAYRLNEQPKLAVFSIERSLMLSDSLIKSHYLRAASIHEWAGNTERAIELYRALLRQFPDNEQARQAIKRLTSSE